MLGNVDDVALEERDGRLVAVGLLRGPGAWAHRQPGRPGPLGTGRSGAASTRARTPGPSSCPSTTCSSSARPSTSTPGPTPSSPAPTASSCGCVATSSAASPAPAAASTPSAVELASAPRQDADLDLPADAHLLSTLIGARVCAPTAPMPGAVVEVRAVQATPMTSRVGPLVVTSIVHGPRRLGGELGYREDPDMGPFLIGSALRWWHRDEVETADGRRAIGGLDGIAST